MAADPLAIAVVGHTNHGKTSLVRTLTWTRDFGEVADRRAVTRRVEWIDIADEDETTLVRLYDTPGLENSIELRDAIEAVRASSRDEGTDLIRRFLADASLTARFPQPTKALQQMLISDVILNVIDARQQTLAKYRDELEILRWANPRIVNVLNFTARPNANTDAWREMLTRGGFGYVASFDVVALRPADELHLLDTIRRLVAQTPHEAAIQRFAELRAAQWARFRRSAIVELAELLIDVAACTAMVSRDAPDHGDAVRTEMMAGVRERERQCYERIIHMRGMADADDARRIELDLPEQGWQTDPFDLSRLISLAKVGGGGAAAGAVAGAVFDVAAAGLTFGIGTFTGALLGGALGAARTQGRALRNRISGVRAVTIAHAVLLHLAQRQMWLINHLMHRGHADQLSIADAFAEEKQVIAESVMRQTLRTLALARGRPEWSSIPAGRVGEQDQAAAELSRLDDPARTRLRDRLALVLSSGEDSEVTKSAAPQQG